MEHLDTKFIRALEVAHAAHQGQKRKGTAIPYISHPMGVASLVFEFGGSEDEVIAALLHDVIEDGGAEWVSVIEAEFGSEVLNIVRECSDYVPEASSVKPPWRDRKTAYLDSVPKKSASALLVTACDKLHNLTAIVRDYREHGDDLWGRFTASSKDTYWYYSELLALFQKLSVPPANELRQKADEFQQLIEASKVPR